MDCSKKVIQEYNGGNHSQKQHAVVNSQRKLMGGTHTQRQNQKTHTIEMRSFFPLVFKKISTML